MRDGIKRVLSLVSAAAFAASMSGCTSGNDTANGDDILIDEITDEPVQTFIIDDTTEEITETTSETDTVTEAADPYRNSGTVLRVASRNEELQNVFELLYGAENLPEGVSFEYVRYPNETDEYVGALNNSFAADEEPIDIFLAEPDYILPFINSDMTLPLQEAGITEADTADMFPYTLSLGTSSDGILKAASWQAEPGVFVYRRDIALEVFGNDDPDYIHGLISADWEGTASALAEKGYYMVSSAGETYRLYGQNRTSPWVDGGGNICIDNSCRLWTEDMRRDIISGYSPNYPMWTDQWISEQNSEGNTFGFCLASWYSEQLIPMWSDSEAVGIFGVCQPPKPYYWGGAFLCISSRTDNLDLCGDVLKKLTCDSENMLRFTAEMGDCCNSRSALKMFAESGLGYSEFYGQDTFSVYLSAAEAVAAGNVTPYDTALDDCYTDTMQDYFNDLLTYDIAENIFYEKAGEIL
ncbi:MAG: extracellular solute-binding protein [Oscillospiraceae bacterium]|nr:extracellular solute-binding protein [Oscillospiraceae bacterium]